MQISINQVGRTAVVQLEGRFVFECHRALREMCSSVLSEEDVSYIQLDMSRLNYLDSAALGMLLLMRDRVTGSGKTLQLKGAQGLVQQVLHVAKFDRMFEMLN